MFLSNLLEPVKAAALEAGTELWQLYQSGNFEQQQKADQSPVTTADLAANAIIIDRLSTLTPEIPIISEESRLASLAERHQWSRYWLIDPMDGTQEFVARSGDFAVSIALVEDGWPALGVIYWPKHQVFYYATRGNGAFKQDSQQIQRINVNHFNVGECLKIAVSRRQPLEPIINLLQVEQNVEYIALGSCSLKSCLIAEGKADCYMRIGPTGEWDTGAVQVIVEEAGGQILDSEFLPLSYNQRDTLANPNFMVLGQASVSWQQLIKAKATLRDLTL
ncbi:3'(2'),5'-bisphosphate nucleotidase CysQ [Rheinheimera salexigens]|uniref:3'(2'),5'-bisphosphate nucleotidase CysQ n=1 Tax=Rheinheimera salexigens TaxID=1628148 RepID=A0A1E7Q296_9GAMM|nr:3'(2'),5'-bisphosphate nucleotidase CysQ [Rheinheimera salexigens]OEY68188.1 3'(2'),5'-bisphosphate nucleotidase [Rheinheimera salexigens]